jgi:hypothetical protein
MSIHVIGFREPDDTWRKMMAVWDACMAAGVEIPVDVQNYFGDYGSPDPEGMEVELPAIEWQNDHQSGLEITITDIPKSVKKIRFYNSW